MKMNKLIKIFIIGFLLTFLMALIPRLGIRTNLLSPLPQKNNTLQEDTFLKKIKPKLELKLNQFQLKTSLIPEAAAGSDYNQATAYAVVDLDSGQVLASKNLSDRLPMASLTKIMTAVVGLDLADPGEKFIVSDKAAAQIPTKVMLKAGEQYEFGRLLSCMLISSANDSAQVVQEGIDNKYGQPVFIKAMNQKAQFLGLKNTHFTNTQGFDDPDHYSSAEDLSILSRYAMDNYPLIAQNVGESVLDLTNNNTDMRFYLNNWNGLLGVYPGVYGIKIGNTQASGNSTIVLSERGGKKVLVVVLGAPGVLERDLWAGELLDLGFSKLALLPPANITEAQLRAKYASWK